VLDSLESLMESQESQQESLESVVHHKFPDSHVIDPNEFMGLLTKNWLLVSRYQLQVVILI